MRVLIRGWGSLLLKEYYGLLIPLWSNCVPSNKVWLEGFGSLYDYYLLFSDERLSAHQRPYSKLIF